MEYDEEWKTKQKELWKAKRIKRELFKEITNAGGVREYMLKFGPFKDVPIDEQA